MEDPIIAECLAELNKDLQSSQEMTSPQPWPSAGIFSNSIREDVLRSFTDVDSLMAFVMINGIDQRCHVVRDHIEQLQTKKKTIKCKRCHLQCRDAEDLDQHHKLCHIYKVWRVCDAEDAIYILTNTNCCTATTAPPKGNMGVLHHSTAHRTMDLPWDNNYSLPGEFQNPITMISH